MEDTTGLDPLDDWCIVQQIELPEKLFYVTEYRVRRYRCVGTGRIVTGVRLNRCQWYWYLSDFQPW